MIVIGLFSSKNPKLQESDSADLLSRISQITPEDIDKLLSLAKNAPESLERDDQLNRYLSIVNQVFGGNTYLSLGDTVQTRQQRYEIYDEMDDTTSYISAALDILSDDATQADESGVVLRIVSESSKVKTVVEDLFDDLDIEGKIGKWARAIAKYGDLFVQVKATSEDGITGIMDTFYPDSIERKDLEGKLLAFCDANETMTAEHIYAPWEFIHFRLKGDIYRTQRKDNYAASSRTKTKLYSLTSAYGQSILRPAIKVYAQLRFVENLIILSRLTNSIRRNIFLVNTGETDPKKSFETIQNYANLLKKDISLDIEKGVYNSQKHTFSYDEDIFIPVTDTKNDVRIESVGGDINIAEQYDLEYLLNKLFSALKIPKAYLNYEQDLNARSTLIQLDIRYARSVSQLQVALVGGLLRLAKIHLAYKGIDPDTVDLDIQLTNVSSIDKEARLEQKKTSVETAGTLWDMLTRMNDKLAETSSASTDSSTHAFSPSYEGEEYNAFGDEEGGTQEVQQAPQSPMDLNYVAEHILSNYFELEQEDIDNILRKKPMKQEEKREILRLTDRKHYPNSDIRAMYPLTNNVSKFKSIRESIATEDNLEKLDLKTFSDEEGIADEQI